MRVSVGAVKDTPTARRFIQIGHPQRLIPRNRGLEGPAISTHQVTGTIESPETIEIPLTVGFDTPKEFAIQEKQPNTGNLKELWDAHNHEKENGYGHPPAIWIDWVELEGPLSSPVSGSPLQAILAKHLDVPNLQQGPASDIGNSPSIAETEVDKERARVIFTEFAHRAFRDVAPEAEFIDRLVAIYVTRRNVGDSFEKAIRTPLSVILASPDFFTFLSLATRPTDADSMIANWRYGFPISSGADHQMQNYFRSQNKTGCIFPKYFGSR